MEREHLQSFGEGGGQSAGSVRMGHLWRDKWTAQSGPLSQVDRHEWLTPRVQLSRRSLPSLLVRLHAQLKKQNDFGLKAKARIWP